MKHDSMRIINRRTFYQTRMKADGTEYVLYTYEVGSTEDYTIDLIDDLKEYKVGDRVEVWFDGKYNKPKMRPYKEKRG